MTSVPHSGAKSVTPGGSVAGGGLVGRGREWIASASPLGYGSHNGVTVTDNRGLVVAVAIGDVPELDAIQTARLIAAAPELLEAVWSLVEHFERVDGDERHKAVIAIGTSAITKATAGETRNAEPIHRRDGDEG